jgi:maltooligosyltrehalose trehalohydrolase
VGAEVLAAGGVDFRVWAPEHSQMDLVLTGDKAQLHPMQAEPAGYWSVCLPQVSAGTRYKFRIDGGDWYPDPSSRYQPDGPHGDSQVVDPAKFAWSDAGWTGVSPACAVIYELHIGTFTKAGTWSAACDQLPFLAELGITLLEVMPVNDFAGNFGWGYDGVNEYAPSRLYGTPDEFRRFVDVAHGLGMGVILDVVYNHLGPDGNYLPSFSRHYLTTKHETDWGEAINFYAEESTPVREYFIANAGYWIEEFHLDGLRLDATQNIYDESKDHILSAIAGEVRFRAGKRSAILIGENEPQDTKLVRAPQDGGYGLDALWNDDFHHSAIVRLTGNNEAYYTDYRGMPQEFISAAKYGYLFQGQWYKWQNMRRGTPALTLPHTCFVNFIQNHDQVANSARGLRAHQLTSPAIYRAMTALTLLLPGIPMLFMGQEFSASSPFLYFAEQKDDIVPLVQEGRRKFLAQFRSLALPEMRNYFADPCDRHTFEQCKLDHAERQTNRHVFDLHKDLLRLRREQAAFHRNQAGGVDGAVLSADAFVLRFFGEDGPMDDRLLAVNFGLDLRLSPAPEPLLAPPECAEWDVLWSSADPAYGGNGTPPLDTVENWKIPGQTAVVLQPGPRERTNFSSLGKVEE